MASKSQIDEFTIPLRLHPRVFAALGADLVTNDIVAIIELVKNSYDAFAKNVWIRFRENGLQQKYLEITDDGRGMTRSVIENVWSVVATPYKHKHPYVMDGRNRRRVSGEKGLGRLSAARLGSTLRMLTRSKGKPCLQVYVNWQDIAEATNITDCNIKCETYSGPDFTLDTGTIIQISGLHSEWDAEMVEDLRDNLSRFISPFSTANDFDIYLEDGRGKLVDATRIEAPKFLSSPKYRMHGKFNSRKELVCEYQYNPIGSNPSKPCVSTISFAQICQSNHLTALEKQRISSDLVSCGEFSFDIRAWDIGNDDIDEISENFGVKKGSVRRSIRTHRGISVYRDGVLVIPKSENARDWLGLDLRRVSLVGKRLSTSQIVGNVSITAKDNPNLVDKSDREGLMTNIETKLFNAILITSIEVLENSRDADRIRPDKEKPLESLFEKLDAEGLLADVMSVAEEGGSANDTVPLLRAFSSSLTQARNTIEERFVYYSRLATVGTIAEMLIHEIRNRTTTFGAVLERLRETFSPLPLDVAEGLGDMESAINSLESLADTFAPLANRNFKRGKRDSNLYESIQRCLNLNQRDIKDMNIKVNIDESTNLKVAVDPGEIDAILLNLILNSIYWLHQTDSNARKIEFQLDEMMDNERIRVSVSDSGPGIAEEDVERVMWPGVTRKPGGLGMGLTVAAEVVAGYGGRLGIKYPGTIGGATVVFDLPLIR